jgi:ribosome-associated heat shock protein Hsp15
MSGQEPGSVRIDKWLWAARFFKTRSLAAEAVSGGKVHLNGQRVKPARAVRPGDVLRIHKGSFEFIVTIDEVAEKRASAKIASGWYTETEDSVSAREQRSEQLRLLASSRPVTEGRPNKKDRRLIHRFKRKQ